MPNTKSVRSFKQSGLKKSAEPGGSGGVASQGLKEDYNSTFPANQIDRDRKIPSNVVDRDDADSAPINREYAENLPNTVTPFGSVDIGSVSRGGKE